MSKINHIIYVIAWEKPEDGSGGFEWRWHAAEAQSIENYMLPDATLDGCRVKRFPYDVPWGMSDEQITDLLSWEFAHSSFDPYLFPEDYVIAGTGLTNEDFDLIGRSAAR